MNAALLIAEPEPTGSVLERHLINDGFDVLRTDEGDHALQLAELSRPDLVVLGDDLELCSRIRDIDRRLPVIVIGRAQADTVDRVRAFARGCDEYLPRPFQYEELLWRIP